MTNILRTTLRGLSLLGLLFIALPGANAQQPTTAPKTIELEVQATKILPGRLEDGVAPPSNLEVSAAKTQDEATLVKALEVGKASLKLVLAGKVEEYIINVVPAPQRIYINLNESQKLTFPDDVDEAQFSNTRIVRQRQPNARTLLLEAITEGKTALTVVTKNGTIYLYSISTFDNRGADILRIRNEFSVKNYKNLNIDFLKDQATLTGYVATQEELDDAVRIVRQYTPYVDVKVALGIPETSNTEFNPDELDVMNQVLRIANVKGLTVRVRFPRAVVKETSTTTRQEGDVLNPATTTQINGVTQLTGNSFQLKGDDQGNTVRPRQTEDITRSTTRNKTIPEKIYLYGELEDDLEEARAIRVARTYSPLVVSFINVKDPIQLRLKVRFLTINKGKTKDVGILWTNSTGGDQPTINAGVQYGVSGSRSATNVQTNQVFASAIAPAITYVPQNNVGIGAFESLLYSLQADVVAQLRLIDRYNIGKVLQEANIYLTNGQVGDFFSGTQIPYVTSTAIAINGTTVSNVGFFSVGVSIFIVPLNYERASQQQGESLSIQYRDGTTRISTLSKYMQFNRTVIENSQVPLVDESVKYVDENGIIGMDISTSVSVLDQLVTVNPGQNAPQVTNRSVESRTHLRERQSVVLGGVFDDVISKNVRSLPFLRNLPVFGWFFENPVSTRATDEIVIVLTPEIIRMRDMEARRFPRPALVESRDAHTELGSIPIMKAVPYRPTTVEMHTTGDDAKAKDVAPVSIPDRTKSHAEMPTRGNARLTKNKQGAKKNAEKSTAEAPSPKPLPVLEGTPAPISTPASVTPQIEDRPAGSPAIDTHPSADSTKRKSSSQASMQTTGPEIIP